MKSVARSTRTRRARSRRHWLVEFGSVALLAVMPWSSGLAQTPAEPPAPPTARIVMKAALGLPPGHFALTEFEAWASHIARATEGRVRIEFDDRALPAGVDPTEALRQGTIDIGLLSTPALEHSAPLLQLSAQPWMVSDAHAASVALWRTWLKSLASRTRLEGIQMLSLFHFTGGQIASLTDQPIQSLDELRGRAVAAPAGEAESMLLGLGIRPMIIEPTTRTDEPVPPTADAIFGLPWHTLSMPPLVERVRSVTVTQRSTVSAGHALVVGQMRWAKLSEPDRAAIRAASGERLSTSIGEAADEAAAKARKRLEASGIRIIAAQDGFEQTLREAAAPVHARFHESVARTGLKGDALVQEFQREYRTLTR